MEAAAMASAYGLDGMRLFTTDDPLESTLIQIIADRADKIRHKIDQSRATQIGNELAKRLSKMWKR